MLTLHRRTAARSAAVLATALLLGGSPVLVDEDASAKPKDRTTGPLVIGHRGASGYRPEHTLEAYRLAIDLGADYIEPDLVSTKDGVLVARHENEISGTTDVAERPEFAGRRTTRTIDGQSLTGWFTEDFTLAELRTLRAVERIPELREENTLYDGRYQVPTLQEVIDLARAATKREGRTIGVYPETKHPSYFRSIGLPLEEPLLQVLERNGYKKANDPVIVQSFEVGNLEALSRRTDVRLVQLLGGSGGPADRPSTTYDAMSTRAGLARIATYADGVGPDKNRVIPRRPDGTLGTPTGLVTDAHAEGLVVHPFTFRNENAFLPPALRSSTDPAAYGDAFAEYRAFLDAGVDGMFSDNPDTARAAVDDRRAARPAA